MNFEEITGKNSKEISENILNSFILRRLEELSQVGNGTKTGKFQSKNGHLPEKTEPFLNRFQLYAVCCMLYAVYFFKN
jgi:hypothetical protein